MKKIIHYFLIVDCENFIGKVNAMIQDGGWQPFGPPFSDSHPTNISEKGETRFCQAMVRYEDDLPKISPNMFTVICLHGDDVVSSASFFDDEQAKDEFIRAAKSAVDENERDRDDLFGEWWNDGEFHADDLHVFVTVNGVPKSKA